MKQSADSSPTATTDEPAVPSTRPRRPRVRISDQLTDSLIDSVLDSGRDPRPGRAGREDGWTPDRIAAFLNALAVCGVVTDAARAAGMSVRSAYALRNSAKGRTFLLAWRAALLLARRRMADDLMSRAINGCVDIFYRDGEIVGERHRYDNRLSMAMLSRLDRLAEADDQINVAARLVAEEFEQFVGIASRGGTGAAGFVRARARLGDRIGDEAELIERTENYGRYGVGLGVEIDVSDLDPEQKENWTMEQTERAQRAGLLEDPAKAKQGWPHKGEPSWQGVTPTGVRICWRPVQEGPGSGPEPEAEPGAGKARESPQGAAPETPPDSAPVPPLPPETPDDGRPPPGWVAPG